jgi:hypothetical protein
MEHRLCVGLNANESLVVHEVSHKAILNELTVRIAVKECGPEIPHE